MGRRRNDLIEQLLDGTLNTSKLVIENLDRRRTLYQDVGWLYALHNPAFRNGLIKVGKTCHFPTKRAQQLSRRTGLPEDFQILHYIHVGDHHRAESYAHRLLDAKRYRSDREFFEVSLPRVAEVFDQVAQEFPLVVDAGRTSHVLPQDYGDWTIISCNQCGTKNRVRSLPVTVQFRCSCGRVHKA